MNILSLFDGMSCGQLALQRANINYDNYFASEIDKYAITITQKNFSNTIQLGDITKWKEWNLPKIDLILAGSPCQGFSNAGTGLNFDDPRSKLFFDFIKILQELKPKWFLLENVKMKQEWKDIITSYVGVEPIEINSALVSAQNRKRLYWTNILNILQPEDKGILLKDILLCDAEEPILHNLYGGFKETKPRVFYKKSPTIRTAGGGGHIPSVMKIGNIYPSLGQNGNIYSKNGKSPTLSAGIGITGNGIGSSNAPKISITENKYWRRLTPLECERLQTVPDNYTAGVSNTQRYKMLGNGWTVDVIAHIFRNLKADKTLCQ